MKKVFPCLVISRRLYANKLIYQYNNYLFFINHLKIFVFNTILVIRFEVEKIGYPNKYGPAQSFFSRHTTINLYSIEGKIINTRYLRKIS